MMQRKEGCSTSSGGGGGDQILRDSWVRKFEVSDPRRHRKGFTVYKVVSTVFPKQFPDAATKISVWKRYKDFKLLYKELHVLFHGLYLNLKGERPFPQLPKDRFFKRFDPGVIEERRKLALDLLEFAGTYPQLFTNRVFLKFFEDGYYPRDFVGNAGEVEESGNDAVLIEEEKDGLDNCLMPEKLWNPHENNDGNSSSSPSFSGTPEGGASSQATPVHETLSSTQKTDVNVVTFSDNQDQPSQGHKSIVVRTSSDSSQSHAPMPYSLRDTKMLPILGSCTSLTEELDYLEEEFDFLPQNNSHSPVHRLPSSSSLQSIRDKANARSSSSFNVFDFLPVFTRKQEKEAEPSLSEASASYVKEAAGFFTVAQNYESNGDMEGALECYTEGIRILLDGAQSDTDQERRTLVKRKVAKYLAHAEELKNIGTHSFLQVAEDRSSLHSQDYDSFVHLQDNVIPSAIEDLKNYKIIRCRRKNKPICETFCSSSMLLVAVDLTAKEGPDCFAVKVLRKSSSPLDREKPSLIPSSIPFMVELQKWFNTEDAIVLILQYAAGGRLVDFIRSYQTKEILSPKRDHQSLIMGEEAEQTILAEQHVNDDDDPQESLPMATQTDTQEQGNMQNNLGNTPLKQQGESSGSLEVTNSSQDEHFLPNIPSHSDAEVDSVQIIPEEVHNVPDLDDDTDSLIQNSRALLDLVSKTLEEQKHKSKPDIKVKESPAVAPTCSEFQSDELASSTTNNETTSSDFTGEEEDCRITLRIIPERCVKVWAAEMIIALDRLHLQGITYGDLDLDNILLGDNGHILMSYRALWNEIDDAKPFWNANSFCAPEVANTVSLGRALWKVHPSADWWSLGAILYFLLSGYTLQDMHPEGLYHPQTVICVPDFSVIGDPISNDARTLLLELLRYNPSLRLGYYGAEEIKTHPFFSDFDWNEAEAQGGAKSIGKS